MDKKDYKQQNVTKTWLNNKIYTINTNIQEKKIQIDIGTRVQGVQMGVTSEKGDIYRGKRVQNMATIIVWGGSSNKSR